PVLSITADEVWSRLPGTREESVHLALFPADAGDWRNEALEGDWRRLLDVRERVNAVLEEARQRKEIGNALSAHVSIAAPADLATLLEQHRDELAMWLITSSIDITQADGSDLVVTVRHADGDKCPRCWRFVTETAKADPVAGLCLRCVDA